MIRLFLLTAVFAFLLAISYTNQGQMVSLYLLGGKGLNPVPLYMILFVAFFLGNVFAAIAIVPGWTKSFLDRRKKAKRIKQLETDLDRIRSAALKGDSAPFPVPGSKTRAMHDD